MNWAEKIKSCIDTVQAIAEALGRTLLVFFGVFIAVAVGTGHPALLGVIRDRLILAGVTSLKTPFGDIDPGQMGQLDSISRALEINAVRASDLAEATKDPKAREALELIANELKEQQRVQIVAINKLAKNQRPGQAAPGDDHDQEGWLYLGRRNGDKWRPPAFSIGEAAYPLKPGDGLVVKSDSLVYDKVDCRASADAGGDTPARPSFLLVADSPLGMPVRAAPIECPSTGGTKMVWAKVRVPAAKLVKVMP